jgi:hypothetical protein
MLSANVPLVTGQVFIGKVLLMVIKQSVHKEFQTRL